MTWRDVGQAAFFKFVDEHKPEYIQHLREWVEIPSVSCQSNTRDEVVKMIVQAQKEFSDIGAKMWLVDNPKGTQFFADGESVEYPPVLLGTYPETFDPKKKTILLYGHLDVQPAQRSDGWDTEPFELVEKDGKMYGRGSTDDKGPVLGWLLALKAFQDLNIELNVNLKFCFEGMEESGSVGLSEVIFDTCPEFFNDPTIDGTCISDNYWLGLTKPCLTYGLRGIGYWHLTVEGASRDLHSGVFGGTCHEAMTDLVNLFSSLVNNKGEILIPGVNDDVAPVTAEEEAIYDTIDFDKEEFKACNGVNLIKECKKATLMGRWRNPSLSLHGIEGAFYEPGEKTVIPRRVIGKFSIRMVPDMKPAKIHELVQAHIDAEVKRLGTPNKVWLTCVSGAESGHGEAWYGNPNGFLFEAGKKATEMVYKQQPDMTREGGSIPVTLEFQKATQKPVILLPMGAADDGAHSQNEKLNIRNYIEGVKLLGTFLQEIQ